jgi:hypothetical protein
MKLIIRVSKPAEKLAVEPAEKLAVEPAEKPAEPAEMPAKPAEMPAKPAEMPVQGGIKKTKWTCHSSIPKPKADVLSRLHELRDKIFCQTKALTTLRQTVKEPQNFEKEQELVRDIERLKRLESIASLEFQNMCEVRRR